MDVEVAGAGDVVRALRKFNTDAYKILMQEVKDVAAAVAADVRESLPVERPLSGWGAWSDSRGDRVRDLEYVPSQARSKVRSGARQKHIRGIGSVGVVGWVTEYDPAAAIFMVAGAIPGSQSKTGVGFERGLNARFGRKFPRVMGDMYAKWVKDAGAKVDAALEKAAREVGMRIGGR